MILLECNGEQRKVSADLSILVDPEHTPAQYSAVLGSPCGKISTIVCIFGVQSICTANYVIIDVLFRS